MLDTILFIYITGQHAGTKNGKQATPRNYKWNCPFLLYISPDTHTHTHTHTHSYTHTHTPTHTPLLIYPHKHCVIPNFLKECATEYLLSLCSLLPWSRIFSYVAYIWPWEFICVFQGCMKASWKAVWKSCY